MGSNPTPDNICFLFLLSVYLPYKTERDSWKSTHVFEVINSQQRNGSVNTPSWINQLNKPRVSGQISILDGVLCIQVSLGN